MCGSKVVLLVVLAILGKQGAVSSVWERIDNGFIAREVLASLGTNESFMGPSPSLSVTHLLLL